MTYQELKITSYLYNKFTNYDERYQELSLKLLDLTDINDLDKVLKFLRDWGCRQFKKECHLQSAESLKKWYINYQGNLPEMNENLLDMTDSTMLLFEELFNELMNSYSSTKLRKDKTFTISIGPVGAAKTLFALRKNVFPPWDNPIIDELNLTRDGKGYCQYLFLVKQQLVQLNIYCEENSIEIYDVPNLLGRPFASLPKLIDEYFWVSITRECKPVDLINIINNVS